LDPNYVLYGSKLGEVKHKFPTIKLKDVLTALPQYGANEIAIEGDPQVDVRYIRITDIDEYGNLNDDFKTVANVEEKYVLANDDLLFARSGATAGKAFIYKNEFGKAIFAGYLIRFKIDKSKALPQYVFYYTQLQPYKNWVKSIQRPSGQPNINSEEYKELELPLPNLEVQQKIVKRLDDVFIQKKHQEFEAQQIIKNIDEAIAQRIGFNFPVIEFKSTFKISLSDYENRLDPHFYLPGFKALIDNIRQINHALLGDIVEFSNETWNQRDGFENEFPYIEISEIDLTSGRIQNISYTPLSEAPSRARMLVRTNDIIVSTTRPHRGAIARINEEQNGFIASTGFAVLRRMLRQDVSKEYLFYILRTQICLLQMLQRSSGGSYPAITTEELKKIYIPIPSPKVQQQVVADIKAFIDKAEELKAKAKGDLGKAKQEIEALILS
jgi:type I restriction enzyme, S subunit